MTTNAKCLLFYCCLETGWGKHLIEFFFFFFGGCEVFDVTTNAKLMLVYFSIAVLELDGESICD